MRFLRLSLIPVLLIALISFSSCDDGAAAELTIEEEQLNALTAKTWTIDQVRFGSGNTDRTTEYTGMTLTIAGTFSAGGTYNYTVANRPSLSPWPASGTWKFVDGDAENTIIRTEDNLQITYSVTDTQLQLVFNYQGAGYARTSAVAGTWTFLFK